MVGAHAQVVYLQHCIFNTCMHINKDCGRLDSAGCGWGQESLQEHLAHQSVQSVPPVWCNLLTACWFDNWDLLSSLALLASFSCEDRLCAFNKQFDVLIVLKYSSDPWESRTEFSTWTVQVLTPSTCIPATMQKSFLFLLGCGMLSSDRPELSQQLPGAL